MKLAFLFALIGAGIGYLTGEWPDSVILGAVIGAGAAVGIQLLIIVAVFVLAWISTS